MGVIYLCSFQRKPSHILALSSSRSQVQFKKTIRNFTLRPGDLTPVQTGDFVIVQADRGEDLGVITDSYPLQTFIDRRYAMRAYMDEEDQNVGYILRVASPSETKLLPEKFQDEEMIFKVRA